MFDEEIIAYYFNISMLVYLLTIVFILRYVGDVSEKIKPRATRDDTKEKYRTFRSSYPRDDTRNPSADGSIWEDAG